MTDTENNTARGVTEPPLTWKRLKGFGVPTYRAETPDWVFTCDRPQKNGVWVVRGWGPGASALYREAKTLKAAKRLAADRLSTHPAEQARHDADKGLNP